MTEPNGSPSARILIVEDEMFVSMLLEDILQDLNYEAVGPAARLEEALSMARDATFDAAVLDVNLNGRQTYSVADILSERGIPAIFATGYGAGGIPERYRHCPILAKPFRRDDLARILSQALAGARR